MDHQRTRNHFDRQFDPWNFALQAFFVLRNHVSVIFSWMIRTEVFPLFFGQKIQTKISSFDSPWAEASNADVTEDANTWRQLHKIGPKMIEKDLHVNEQYKVYQQLHQMRYWFTKSEVEDMIARDSCRKSEIYITKCMVS